jgi:DNA-directed RNA polymerase specialized sigma24 family protein
MSDRKYVLPSETRASVVIGLQSHTSQKWRLFLQDGPYWNYIARFVASKRYFKRDDTRIDDVVSTTIARVAKSLASGRFVYKAAGQGYFRAFLKTVAMHVALDMIRKDNRCLEGSGTASQPQARYERDVLSEGDDDSIADTKKLNAYDATAAIKGDVGGRRSKGVYAHLVSMDDLKGVFDGGDEGTLDPASMQRYHEECTHEEQKFLKRVQKNVFSLALVSVLSDETVPLARREMLNMLYVGKMTPGDIYALDDFKHLKRGTFDKKVFDAKQSLVKPILEFWKAVAPKFCENSEEELQELWRALLVKPSTRQLAKATLRRLKDNDEMPVGVKV